MPLLFRSLLSLLLAAALVPRMPAETPLRFPLDQGVLLVEAVRPDLLRLHFNRDGATTAMRPATPMVVAPAPDGASVQVTASGVKTAAGELRFDPAGGAVTVRAADGRLLTSLQVQTTPERVVLALERGQLEHAYGLGEHFNRPASPDGDLVGRRRVQANPFGNAMEPYLGGYIGNDQIPVCYFVGPDSLNFALMVDEVRPLTWDLQRQPWTVAMEGDGLTWYLLLGPDLSALRQSYMQLTGRPPLPPRQAFGLWVSEYGYDDWNELDQKRASLQAAGFPVDGFVLDLQWFGDIEPGGDKSQMGRLAWDPETFGDAAAWIARLRDEHGVGIVPIEESYITRTLPVYARLREQGLLVRDAGGGPVDFERWWGAGGMLDWSNPATRLFWHAEKRAPLLEAGVLGHWTDLGEPETYAEDGRYHGLAELGWTSERDLHNLYNLFWAQGIWEGYAGTHPDRRPWILSRSGTAGVQRYGTMQWSGDIGSNLRSLSAHLNVQMHMSMSGIDYYGADIGGFNRWAHEADPDEMYTRWFAHGALLDVPVRPHTSNRENRYETAPDRIGDVAGNLANIRLRYRLVPYLYSLAYRAWRHGEPLMPPLVYAYQDDPEVRELGRQKLIGRDLMVACAASPHQRWTDVYLPAGTWIDYHTGRWHESTGSWVRRLPVILEDGRVRLPLLARGGALLPEMHVDDQTMNTLGKRRDGSRRDELVVRVFPHGRSQFELYEDDGGSLAHRTGAFRRTAITQETQAGGCSVSVAAAEGTFRGAVAARATVLKIAVPPGQRVTRVTLNGAGLSELADDAAAQSVGYRPRPGGLVEIRSAVRPVGEALRVRIDWVARSEDE